MHMTRPDLSPTDMVHIDAVAYRLMLALERLSAKLAVDDEMTIHLFRAMAVGQWIGMAFIDVMSIRNQAARLRAETVLELVREHCRAVLQDQMRQTFVAKPKRGKQVA